MINLADLIYLTFHPSNRNKYGNFLTLYPSIMKHFLPIPVPSRSSINVISISLSNAPPLLAQFSTSDDLASYLKLIALIHLF